MLKYMCLILLFFVAVSAHRNVGRSGSLPDAASTQTGPSVSQLR